MVEALLWLLFTRAEEKDSTAIVRGDQRITMQWADTHGFAVRLLGCVAVCSVVALAIIAIRCGQRG